MAKDLAALKARITRELHRSDLANDIASAIQDAIRQYRSRAFEFTDKVGTFSTTADVPSYAALNDIGQILDVKAQVPSTDYPLEALTFTQYRKLAAVDSPRGQPSAYAFFGGQVYIWPMPDNVYPITVAYQQRVAPPVADTDVTVWTDEAEPLIRACAKKLVFRDVIQDPDGANAASFAEREALGVLMDEAMRLQDSGPISCNW